MQSNHNKIQDRAYRQSQKHQHECFCRKGVDLGDASLVELDVSE
uniref:Uncharacterized protein n=1 Tax=Nelumbo nucifera TaxID=4432 RepID=A0A822YFH2_NELNU|nr:TPA_asm: hypothetical protein HUJ06_011775 [Nelumbo nucifera]